MKVLRWATAIAVFFAVAPAVLWLAATVVYRQWCAEWCLMCIHQCTVGGLDLGWLLAYGLIFSPYLLLFTAPLALVLLALLAFFRRQSAAAS